MKFRTLLLCILLCFGIAEYAKSQDLSQGVITNDLTVYPMQDIAKPGYLDTIIDPSFGTTIRRISDAGIGNAIVPMYSTIQAWNSDETLMILYEVGNGHLLLNGMTYEFIRELDDVSPADLEQIFWDFNDPDIFYYPNVSREFIRYTVSSGNQQILFDMNAVISNCSGFISMGNDVQMMSEDNDVVAFRCNNDRAYYYRISTGQLTEFPLTDVGYTAPMPAPSGNNFYHRTNAYDAAGNLTFDLNESSPQHSSMGSLSNGNDAYFAVSFAQGPDGGCLGNIIAHDLTTGACYDIISENLGYEYSQSGTHISALAHKNTHGGWMAASMIGFDEDGQSLLDQELVIARASEGNVLVSRIGHHRSDENEFDYWGEPHAVLSPTGTRVLFGSDWSGAEDGQSVDSYVVELPVFTIVLPVELVEFSARAKKCAVDLKWKTLSEDNNEEISIQRSSDGSNFNDIEIIPGAGNSDVILSYDYTDLSELRGTYYYRLEFRSSSGERTYSPIQTVSIDCKTGEARLFPNPAKEMIAIHSQLNSSSAILEVLDIHGRLLIRSEILSLENRQINEELSVEALSNGLYYVRILESNHPPRSLSLVIAR